MVEETGILEANVTLRLADNRAIVLKFALKKIELFKRMDFLQLLANYVESSSAHLWTRL